MDIQRKLEEASLALTRAVQAYDEWAARGEPVDGRPWVTAGHDAVQALDRVRWHVSEARGELVAAMRADANERASRVDALVASHALAVAQGGDVYVLRGEIVTGSWDGPAL